MWCCVSDSSTVEDEVSETSEARRARIVPGFQRPESELDWEDITVFQWPNAAGSEGFQRPASTIGSVAATDLVRQHEIKLAAAIAAKNARQAALDSKKKKKQGLFQKNSGSRKKQAPQPPREGSRLPGDIPRVTPAPPIPPGRDDLPHLTARRLAPKTGEKINGEIQGVAHRKAVPLHGNLQLNFAIGGNPNPDDVRSLPSGTAVDSTHYERIKSQIKPAQAKRSIFSLKVKRPTFLSNSAFGTKRKQSPKAYRAPKPPGFPPPSSIDTGITDGRLPLGEQAPPPPRLDTIPEPNFEESEEEDEDFYVS